MGRFDSFKEKKTNITQQPAALNQNISESKIKPEKEKEKVENDVLVSYLRDTVKYEAHVPDIKSAVDECENLVNRNIPEIHEVQINGKEWRSYKNAEL